jgi:exodeoxyribonuclease V alpha subunit
MDHGFVLRRKEFMETHNTEPPDPAVDAGASPSSDAEPVSALAVLHESGVILHQDYYLAQSLGRAFPGVSDLCRLSCALASKALAEGHICLDLASMAGQKISAEPGAAPLVRLPGLGAWTRELAESACVATAAAASKKGDRSWVLRHPLVLDRDNFLYLAKYYDFQERLIHNIAGRVSGNSGTEIASNFIDKGLEEQFDGQDPERTAGQRRAVKKALESRFLVISGGPGTGKTFVTAIIRSVLENWHREQGLPGPVILSLAPTGKAAERMEVGRTIHSVLRPSLNGVGFLHGADNPLRADLVIVDEASMIDMALMTRLVEAVPKTARLILLGDKDQLSPVQAGAVFTDLCMVRGLEASRAFLSVNFRSGGNSGISTLARAVNENDPRDGCRCPSGRGVSGCGLH